MGAKAAAAQAVVSSENEEEKPYLQVQNTGDIGQIKRVYDECVVAVRRDSPASPPPTPPSSNLRLPHTDFSWLGFGKSPRSQIAPTTAAFSHIQRKIKKP